MQRIVRALLLAVPLLLWSGVALAAVGGDTVVSGEGLSALVNSPLPWQEKLGLLLTNPVVSTILLILGLTGVAVEIATVGSFGIFGAVGSLSFLLYFLGSFWYGSLSPLSLWLLVIGLALLAVEIFAIPGFGVCGVLGILSVLAALILAAPKPQEAIWSLLIALAVAAILIWLSLKNRRTRKLWKRLILSQRLDDAEGFVSADPALAHFLGEHGRSLTTLRPAGSARIGEEKVDVVTQGEFIEADRPIEVIQVEGVRVVVRECPEA